MVDELAAALASASGRELAASIGYTIVVCAVVGELLWLVGAASGRDRAIGREAATAAGMAVGALAVGAVYLVVFTRLWGTVGTAAPAVLDRWWEGHPVLAFTVAFIAWDGAGFVYHVIGHRTRVGWAAHRPHHTGTRFNLSLGLRLSWMPWHGLLVFPWLALLGWDLTTVALCAIVSNTWQALEHSAVEARLPAWVRATLMTPEAHRHHHAVGTGLVNLGPVLTVWDRWAGTWRPGPVPKGTPYGLGVTTTANPVVVELRGWAELVRRRRTTGPEGAARSDGRSALPAGGAPAG